MLINKKIFLKYRYLIASISGILMALPLVYSALGILQWISLIPTAIILYLLTDDITVKYSYFISNEEMYTQIKNGASYDIIIPSDYMINRLIASFQLFLLIIIRKGFVW